MQDCWRPPPPPLLGKEREDEGPGTVVRWVVRDWSGSNRLPVFKILMFSASLDRDVCQESVGSGGATDSDNEDLSDHMDR